MRNGGISDSCSAKPRSPTPPTGRIRRNRIPRVTSKVRRFHQMNQPPTSSRSVVVGHLRLNSMAREPVWSFRVMTVRRLYVGAAQSPMATPLRYGTPTGQNQPSPHPRATPGMAQRTESLPYRVAGPLLVLYAQPLVRIAALETTAIVLTQEEMRMSFAAEPVPVPEPFAGMLNIHLNNHPNLRTGGGMVAKPWLFPANSTRRGLGRSEWTVNGRSLNNRRIRLDLNVARSPPNPPHPGGQRRTPHRWRTARGCGE